MPAQVVSTYNSDFVSFKLPKPHKMSYRPLHLAGETGSSIHTTDYVPMRQKVPTEHGRSAGEGMFQNLRGSNRNWTNSEDAAALAAIAKKGNNWITTKSEEFGDSKIWTNQTRATTKPLDKPWIVAACGNSTYRDQFRDSDKAKTKNRGLHHHKNGLVSGWRPMEEPRLSTSNPAAARASLTRLLKASTGEGKRKLGRARTQPNPPEVARLSLTASGAMHSECLELPPLPSTPSQRMDGELGDTKPQTAPAEILLPAVGPGRVFVDVYTSTDGVKMMHIERL